MVLLLRTTNPRRPVSGGCTRNTLLLYLMGKEAHIPSFDVTASFWLYGVVQTPYTLQCIHDALDTLHGSLQPASLSRVMFPGGNPFSFLTS